MTEASKNKRQNLAKNIMGKLYIVGIGPGDAANMTQACIDCLRKADVIVGYTGYTSLLHPLFPEKTFFETGMTRERERCRAAVGLAREGKTVCVVSSGDSGVYGMASLVYELAEDCPAGTEPDIEVVPGVTAAVSGAALLGAPLSHDFAVISLSDLLTPWALIEKRLRAAAAGDFAICLYNPGSHKRAGHLRAACTILLETLPEDRLCGIARNTGREGQSVSLMTLGELCERQAEMSETVFVGNAETRRIGGRMVTPRGYRNE
jgi:precorrin-3B C17-methyltransferase